MQKDTKRNFALDVLRVLACYMVMYTPESFIISALSGT